ncbi:MAG TPA: SDR family NAD(P)-dependent oxidoreductase [Bryobacteraceae bacterium]|jgi:3-oxoacyl-[acyl-carrier protein] reductase|nr:SDR family NAD(P)-dependent oxidoreductase [Bryobacteraceae bacterium]
MTHTAIVTGASRGIGRASALLLAQQGASVALLARDQTALEAAASEIRAAGGDCAVCPCDVTDRSSVDAAIAQATAVLGPPTMLVNNAGYGGPFQILSDSSDADYDQVFHTNVRAAFWFCRALLPGMRAAGFGRIVNIASIEALTGASESAHYIASKHALIGYTKAIAAEWGRFGITSNAICPGFIATEMAAGFDPAKITPRIPAGRFADPAEIARIVAFLAAEESSYLNGSVITADGGLLADLGLER